MLFACLRCQSELNLTMQTRYFIHYVPSILFIYTKSIFYRENFPSSRFVLLKGVEKDGITFFTNYGSRKAKEIVCTNIILIIYKYYSNKYYN